MFPTEVWTALLNYGFVGCVRDLFIDGQSKDVRRMAEVQKAVGVKPSCSKEAPKQCLSNPCQNNGICREGWNRYVCDCAATGYLGRSCERGGCFYSLLKLLVTEIVALWHRISQCFKNCLLAMKQKDVSHLISMNRIE